MLKLALKANKFNSTLSLKLNYFEKVEFAKQKLFKNS